MFTLSTPVKYNINISNCNFTSNELTNRKDQDEKHGGAAFGWKIEQDSETIVALKGSTFYKHDTVSQGGAVFVTCYECESMYPNNLLHSLYGCECWDTEHNNAVIVLEENVFNENTAELGGAVSIVCGKSKIIGNIISDNTAEQGGGLSIRYYSEWGGNNKITNNYASYYGGGAYLQCMSMLSIAESIVEIILLL